MRIVQTKRCALIAMSIALAAMSWAVLPDVHAQTPPVESLFVRASVDNDRPYLGQQITYIFKIYQGSGFTLPAGQARYESPGFAGFWNSQRIAQDDYTEKVDSGEYLVRELRTALFPTVVGTVAIDPAALTVSRGNAAVQRLAESPSITVEVRPLPPGAPAGFTGAVGRFDISAEVDAVTGQANDPVQLTITVSGEGNIEALPNPAWPEFVGWRVIESPPDTDIQVVAGQVTGSRSYGIVLVPERAGDLTIPVVEYTYFDPNLERYVQAATATAALTIADSAEGSPAPPPTAIGVTEGQAETEMRPIKSVPPSLRQSGENLTGSAAYWAAWGIPILAIAGAVYWRRRRAALAAGRAEALRKSALPDARAALARAVASGTDPRVAAEEVLLSYFSARLETPLAGLTREALFRQLREAGASSDLILRVETALSAGETARYTPMVVDANRGAAYAEDAAQLLAELEEAFSA